MKANAAILSLTGLLAAFTAPAGAHPSNKKSFPNKSSKVVSTPTPTPISTPVSGGNGTGGFGSNSFAGGNNYYIHTTSKDLQTAWVNQMAQDGAKVVRLWVTGLSGGCVKGSTTNKVTDVEPSIGQYNDDSLAALDALLAQLSQKGIKAVISPHNGNDLDSKYTACDEYCSKYGSSGFYTSQQAASDYDKRLTHILNYQSPSFKKPWSQLSEAILGFDVQNEPFITQSGLAADGDKAGWLCGRATTMKKLIGNSGVLVMTGGIGGSHYSGHEYNLESFAVNCPAVDVISMHSYLTAQQWSAYVPSSLGKVGTKRLMIEEWGVGGKIDSGEFNGIYQEFNKAAIPWIYWEVIPGRDQSQGCSGATDKCCGQSYDGFEIGPGSSKGNIPAAIHGADQAKAAQSWAGVV